MLRSLASIIVVLCCAASAAGEPWQRHTIDDSSRGADGVRLADANGDGLLDIATGWEEGGVIRMYLNPGAADARKNWPAVTVGKVKSPEDAVLVDLDGDGAHDVVSCCEGRTRTLFVHWAPKDNRKYLDEQAWTTAPLPDSVGKTPWMFCLPRQVDGRGGIDLVAGSKSAGGVVGWYQSPPNPRNLAAWKWRPIVNAGWIMSLIAEDIDGDGAADVLFSDRKGKQRGVKWSRQEQSDAAGGVSWTTHLIGGEKHEVMFLKAGDLDADGLTDVVCATRNKEILIFRQTSRRPLEWETKTIPNPGGVPNGKAVALGDIDLDGRIDIVHDANTFGNRTQPGVVWMSRSGAALDGEWTSHDISGDVGVKFDRIELIDLDGDGDLDVLTCEERDNLGVFWYENPTK